MTVFRQSASQTKFRVKCIFNRGMVGKEEITFTTVYGLQANPCNADITAGPGIHERYYISIRYAKDRKWYAFCLCECWETVKGYMRVSGRCRKMMQRYSVEGGLNDWNIQRPAALFGIKTSLPEMQKRIYAGCQEVSPGKDPQLSLLRNGNAV